jgi:hypothetical protein
MAYISEFFDGEGIAQRTYGRGYLVPTQIPGFDFPPFNRPAELSGWNSAEQCDNVVSGSASRLQNPAPLSVKFRK